MKKNVIQILIMAISVSAFGQDDIRIFDSFSKVIVATNVEVELIQSYEEKAEVWIDKGDIKELEIEQIGNAVRIKWEDRYKWRNNRKASIKLYYNELSEVSASSSAHIFSNDLVVSDDLKIYATYKGRVSLKVKTDKVDAKVGSRGLVSIDGLTNNLEVSASYNGTFVGKNLLASNVEAKAMSRGRAAVWASNRITARVAYGGKVSYKGDPSKKRIFKNRWGGGSVKRI